MQAAADQPLSDRRGRLTSRRAVTLALVVALHILTMLVALRPSTAPGPAAGPQSISISLLPAREPAPEHRRKADRPPQPRKPATAPAERIVVAPPVEPDIWSQVIPLTREEYAAADIGKTAPHAAPPAHADDSAATAAGGDGSPAEQLGAGPPGERLYSAEWYREPTPAELATYVPAMAPRIGWGMIACRTVAGFRVEDCREIAQYPPGSGYARAVLEAAWQFRVRPPRVGGRTLVGTWVSIRIDYTEQTRR